MYRYVELPKRLLAILNNGWNSSNNTLTGFISDLSGRKQGVHFTLSPESNTIVPLSHLKSGMYILVLTDQEGNTQTHKIIKQ